MRPLDGPDGGIPYKFLRNREPTSEPEMMSIGLLRENPMPAAAQSIRTMGDKVAA